MVLSCNLFYQGFSVFFLSDHVYMRSEVNSNRSEISNRFEMSSRVHGNLHGDFTATSFETVERLYCACENDMFLLMQT